MLAIGQGMVVLVDVGYQMIYQTISKTGTGLYIPVTVIRKDDDEWRNFLNVVEKAKTACKTSDQSIHHFDRAKPHPLIIGVGLSVQQIQDRIAHFRHLVVAWR